MLFAGIKETRLFFDYTQNVFFPHDEEVLAFDLYLGAGVLAEDDGVVDLHAHRLPLSLLFLAGPYCNDLALCGRLFCALGDNDAALGLLLLLEPSYNNSIVKRSDLHSSTPP